MIIIARDARDNYSRPALQDWSGDTPPDGYAFIPDGLDTSAFYEYMGFVDLELDGNYATKIKGDQAALERHRADTASRVEDVLADKRSALSAACNATITDGSDITLSDGTTAHFTYDIFDQANISEMFSAVVLGATEYPYQAAGGSCRVYSAGDIIIIYATLAGLKTATLTYYHQIKDYLKTLKTVEEIQSVTWGQALEGEYLTHYNETIAAAQAQLQIMLAKLGA